MTARTFYWISAYADECVPCDCSLEGWAEWLSKPDEDWGRPNPAKDGDTFKAQSANRTDHTVTLAAGEMTFSPELADDWTYLALCYSAGGGWNADSISETLDGFHEIVEEAADADPDSGPVAVVTLGPVVTLTFRRDGNRCWMDVGEFAA